MAGFVYVLSNPSMPGIVKIGKTERHPESRSQELHTSGVPTPFVLEFALWVNDAHEVEKLVHEFFSYQRVSKSREFFKISLQDAVKSICNESFHCFSLSVYESDMNIDEGSWLWIANKCGVHPFELSSVIEQVSDNEWNSAAARYAERRERFINAEGRQEAELNIGIGI